MKLNNRRIEDNENAVSHPLEFMIVFGVLLLSFFFIFSSLNSLFVQNETDNFVLKAKAMAISERLIKDVGEPNNWEFKLRLLLSGAERLNSLGLASYIILDDYWQKPPPLKPNYYYKTINNGNDENRFPLYNTSIDLLMNIDNLEITDYTYYAYKYIGPIRTKQIISNRMDYRTLDSDKIYALQKIPYEVAKNALGLESLYDFNIDIKDIDGKEILKYGKSYKNVDAVESFSRTVIVYMAYETKYVGAELTVYVF
jgi:hypothetical protein